MYTTSSLAVLLPRFKCIVYSILGIFVLPMGEIGFALMLSKNTTVGHLISFHYDDLTRRVDGNADILSHPGP